MMKFSLILFLISATVVAQNIENNELSVPESQNYQAINEAVELCRNVVSDEDNCLEVVASAHYINYEALSLCRNQDFYNQLECLKGIVDKKYTPASIIECNTKNNVDQTQCLSQYGYPIVTDELVQPITYTPQNSQGINKAVKLCKKFIYGKGKCLKVISSVRYIDDKALTLCKNQDSFTEKMNCLKGILNKEYVPALIEECKEREFDQINCLSKYGRVLYKSKAG